MPPPFEPPLPSAQVDTLKFKTYTIGQYSIRPGIDNRVCVTLETNIVFNSDSTAEVSPSEHHPTRPDPITPH